MSAPKAWLWLQKALLQQIARTRHFTTSANSKKPCNISTQARGEHYGGLVENLWLVLIQSFICIRNCHAWWQWLCYDWCKYSPSFAWRHMIGADTLVTPPFWLPKKASQLIWWPARRHAPVLPAPWHYNSRSNKDFFPVVLPPFDFHH
jgi:hypothetical protein